MKLSELLPGDHAEVIAVEAEPVVRRRLMDMGLIRGTNLELVRVAPLGDPVEILCRGILLSLRLREAEGITVRKIPGVPDVAPRRRRLRLGRTFGKIP